MLVDVHQEIAERIDPFSLPSIAVENRRTLNDVPAIYFAISGDKQVLYIGQTMYLRTRWMYHNVLQDLKQYRRVRIAWVSPKDLGITTNEEVRRLERACINLYNPPINRVEGSPFKRQRFFVYVPKVTFDNVNEIMRITGVTKGEAVASAVEHYLGMLK